MSCKFQSRPATDIAYWPMIFRTKTAGDRQRKLSSVWSYYLCSKATEFAKTGQQQVSRKITFSLNVSLSAHVKILPFDNLNWIRPFSGCTAGSSIRDNLENSWLFLANNKVFRDFLLHRVLVHKEHVPRHTNDSVCIQCIHVYCKHISPSLEIVYFLHPLVQKSIAITTVRVVDLF